MSVTAKLVVQNLNDAGSDQTTVVLVADYADERNNEWAKYTPSAHLTMTIANEAPALEFFELGKSVTLTFA